jgi:hypothetical protein
MGSPLVAAPLVSPTLAHQQCRVGFEHLSYGMKPLVSQLYDSPKGTTFACLTKQANQLM